MAGRTRDRRAGPDRGRSRPESGRDGRSPAPARIVRDGGPELRRETAGDLETRLCELAALPTDLTSEPGLRAHLVTGPDGGQALLLAMHYLAVDEWSVVPLLRDLGTAYAARRDGRAPEWEPLPVTYGDYVHWTGEVLGDPADPESRHARDLAFWRDRLLGAAGSGLAHAEPATPGGSVADSAVRLFELDPDLHRDLAALARRTRTSLFMVLRSALAAVLADGDRDVTVGSFAAGRAEPVLHPLVGCLGNVVALRADVSGDPTFTDLLARVRDADLTALDHQDAGFADVAAAAGISRPRAVVVQHEQADLDGEQGVLGRLEAIHPGASSADLTFAFYEAAAGEPVTCALTHRVAAVDDPAALAETVLTVLRAAAADPDRPLSALTG